MPFLALVAMQEYGVATSNHGTGRATTHTSLYRNGSVAIVLQVTPHTVMAFALASTGLRKIWKACRVVQKSRSDAANNLALKI